ncbi:MAG: helix-turn-helix domain-containing protein [candidate division WOR-3 bacterium]|nr:MAG: helix-turn-helix domain-containing protein [candidate division WOR-3 bacterium]
MNNRQRNMRVEVVQYYLKNGVSFRQTALKFHIAYRTIFKWVKLYKEQGEGRLLPTYKRPWNRAEPDVEEKIALMKESEPGLTVRQAKVKLEKEGIRISIKGIWGIWKRYGYAGFSQKNMTSNFTDCPWTKEATIKFDRAKELFDRGVIAKSAEVLNSIPALPKNELLPQIPDSLLNIRRQVERIGLLFGKIPVRTYLERLKILYDECSSRNLYYSALIVGLLETMALSWSEEPRKMLQRVEELRGMLKKNKNYFSYLLFAPRLSLLISEGFAYTELLKIKEALAIAKTCRTLLRKRKRVSPLFMRHLGQLYTQLEDYREAEYWYLKSLDRLDGEEEKIAKSLLADIFVVKGEYKKALSVWKDEQLDYWGSYFKGIRIQYVWSLVKGMPHKAISLATKALTLLKKEEVIRNMFGCYFTIASAYCSLGEKTKARRTLKRILPFFVKNRLEDVKTIIEILVSQTPATTNSMLLYERSLPIIKLALLLKNGQYARALRYAEEKGIMGLLHRYIFFFPELITDLLEKGRPSGLPRTMLNLPVFKKEIPVYSVKFLGNLIVHKNQKYLRVKLTSKATAFLIYLAASKSRHISLDKIHKNFWPRSDHPSRNLAHLLVRIRKALRLPSHILYIKENRLSFDCHFITDYGE